MEEFFMDILSICDKNQCDWGLFLMIILGMFVFIFKLALFYWKILKNGHFVILYATSKGRVQSYA
jgi:hypothetical protein